MIQMNNPQQMFMQQNVGNMGNPLMGGPRQQFSQNIGPLQFLEKTTNNIDLGDTRR